MGVEGRLVCEVKLKLSERTKRAAGLVNLWHVHFHFHYVYVVLSIVELDIQVIPNGSIHLIHSFEILRAISSSNEKVKHVSRTLLRDRH